MTRERTSSTAIRLVSRNRSLSWSKHKHRDTSYGTWTSLHYQYTRFHNKTLIPDNWYQNEFFNNLLLIARWPTQHRQQDKTSSLIYMPEVLYLKIFSSCIFAYWHIETILLCFSIIRKLPGRTCCVAGTARLSRSATTSLLLPTCLYATQHDSAVPQHLQALLI
jgi:hypothetical protein